jgi:predicted DsbA family dithiol-disulfide isomerase
LVEDLKDACQVKLEWKSFLLRPNPQEISLDAFRRYTESWLRPAAQPESGTFRVWSTDEPPPSHSVPPAVALKAVKRIAPGAFDRYHRTLMESYFGKNRNVTSPANLARIAEECGLDGRRIVDFLDDETLVREVFADHEEALERGITAVPTVLIDDEWPVVGAQERQVYRQLIERRVKQRSESR